ncbi:MAG: PrsW family intramembrane metalloprotease [Patescibacteria group bacterium]|jgi:RsiW-degrading membrane proteinase PrsW (M82 family)
MNIFIKTLLGETHPLNLLFYLLLCAGPTLLWFFFCLRFDRRQPEPKREIFKFFSLGAIITIPLIFIAGPITNWIEQNLFLNSILIIFILSFLVDGLIEELAKYVLLNWTLYRCRYFDEIKDGFVYGMSLSLGLAFTENILYALFSKDLANGTTILLFRGFTTTFMHYLSGGIIGYHLAMAKFYKSNKMTQRMFKFRGLILAILLHGLYNSIIRFNFMWGFIPLAIILWIIYFIIVYEMKATTNNLLGPTKPLE